MDKQWIKIRKKPIVVRAYRNRSGKVMEIPTLEGVMKAQPDDWIIEGVAGELYPCKPAIFNATYEII